MHEYCGLLHRRLRHDNDRGPEERLILISARKMAKSYKMTDAKDCKNDEHRN